MKSTARKDYEKRERKKKLRTRKLGLYDWIVPIYAWLSLLVLIAGVILSWLADGQAGVYIGAFGWASLCLAVCAGVIGRRMRTTKKQFLGPARQSVAVAFVVAAIDVILLIVGIALR